MAQPAVDGALVGGASLDAGLLRGDLPRRRDVSSGPLPLVTLVILDGWGIAPPGPGNAVELARTPVFDDLVAPLPDARSSTRRGRRSACPTGQMGNSEVGHLTIGSGRILFQDLVRVSRAVEDGSLFENEALRRRCSGARGSGTATCTCSGSSRPAASTRTSTTCGRCSSSREREGMGDRTWVHAFTDGRDVSPARGRRPTSPTLPAERIATVVGRYYAMDRDERWERTDRALDAIVGGDRRERGRPRRGRAGELRARRDRRVRRADRAPRPAPARPGDETPRSSSTSGPDRVRQLTQRLLEADVDVVTMTRYRDDFDCPVAFAEQTVPDTLAEVLSAAGRRQLHAAETEKYAHVTYFFNGGVEEPWHGRGRGSSSRRRATSPSYDLKPEMSAREVAARVAGGARRRLLVLRRQLREPRHGRAHRASSRPSSRRSRRPMRVSGEVVEATHRAGGVCLVTADHGNAEKLLEDDGVSPHTAHTTNPVPLVLTLEGASSGTEASSPTSPRPCSICSGSRSPTR